MSARGRRPGASTARQDILDAAREQFAEKGFARTTVRGIAARAAVDPALVHHYFGTKDELFDAAIQMPVDPQVILAGLPSDPRMVGPELVRRVLGVWDRPEMQERLRGLLGSALTHEGAAETLREMLTRGLLPVVREVAAQDDRRDWRAELVASTMGGLILGRYVVRLPRLTRASSEELVTSIGPVVSHYLHGRV